MKEKPVLFSAPMVRAIQNTKPNVWPAARIDPSKPFKSQTRRIVKPQPSHEATWAQFRADGWHFWGPQSEDGRALLYEQQIHAPYQVGNILWVREQCAIDRDKTTVVYRADPMFDNCKPGDFAWKWRPSIHMPRWACRIRLEVMEVRCQRLQDITEEDAKAEGAQVRPVMYGDEPISCYREQFEILWESINGKGSWAKNDWVFAYTFKRLA